MVLKNSTKRAKEYLEQIEKLAGEMLQDCREGDYRAAFDTGIRLILVVHTRFTHQMNEECK